VDEKQTQHRQHFNLSEDARRKLEELTARRYPGRQRRQSQLIEDLITEAFAKEKTMSSVASHMEGEDPWGTIGKRFAPGQLVTGIITRVMSFGLFVSIGLGIEGIVRKEEIPENMHPLTDLHEGQQVLLRILSIDAGRRRLSLSMRQAVAEEVTEKRRCPRCQREVQAHWKHCVFCGASLERKCRHCGSPYPEVEGARFCFECGNPLDDAPQAFEGPDQEVVQASRDVQYAVGDKVRILDGPFAGATGAVSEVDEEHANLTILVRLGSRETPVIVSYLQVEKL
jgi:transcription antitermination factor NusG